MFFVFQASQQADIVSFVPLNTSSSSLRCFEPVFDPNSSLFRAFSFLARESNSNKSPLAQAIETEAEAIQTLCSH
jgi:hypothetical protein